MLLYSPVVVESDVDIKITAKRIAWGKWVNCGQTCLAPDYILTTNALKQSLVNALRDALDEFYGASIQTSIDYNRIINKQHFEFVIYFIYIIFFKDLI